MGMSLVRPPKGLDKAIAYEKEMNAKGWFYNYEAGLLDEPWEFKGLTGSKSGSSQPSGITAKKAPGTLARAAEGAASAALAGLLIGTARALLREWRKRRGGR